LVTKKEVVELDIEKVCISKTLGVVDFIKLFCHAKRCQRTAFGETFAVQFDQ
jgi:hypothetical protein